MATTNITRDKDQLINQLVSLDFYDVRQNLINFLQNQPQFTDFNFEGSNLSVILDILSYYTFYKGVYLNAHISEMFLPTAVQRISAVSRAKQQGYVPTSVISSIAQVQINLLSTLSVAPASIDIPTGTVMTVQQNGERFTFSTLQDFTALPTSNPAVYQAVLNLTEGQPISTSVTMTQDNITDPIILDNQNIDTTTLAVVVLSTASAPVNSGIVFNKSTDFTTISSSSNVYFLEEIENMLYDIYFGDGILGRALTPGNVVNISYLVSSGALANGASSFALSTPIPNATLSNVSGFPGITTISAASGGGPIEDVPSIKINSPLSWQSQQRAVVPRDFLALLNQNFSSFIQAATVWGGEDNLPVALGYVFISILQKGTLNPLTAAQVTEIQTLFKKRYSILCIQPIVVNPDFVFINVVCTVIYNSLSTQNPGSLIGEVTNTINTYGNTLQAFGSYFKYSPMGTAIDETDPGITNSLSVISLQKQEQISNNALNSYQFSFYNAINAGSISSSQFTYGTASGTVNVGGTGWAVGNQFTINGGSPTLAATGVVTSVTGGVVTGFSFLNSGYYPSATPLTPVSLTGATTTPITGTGSGLTVNLTVYTYPSASITDDRLGNMHITYTYNSVTTTLSPVIGTVNYSNGQLDFSNFEVCQTNGPATTVQVNINANPQINDIYSSANAILVLVPQAVSIQADVNSVVV